jgi:Domain of unknown function (DUF397)
MADISASVPAPVWLKSTYSAANGNCVEVAFLGASVAVRDSKNQGGPVLRFGRDAWAAFVAEIRSGAVDGW